MVEVGGQRQDDLVARLGERHHRQAERLVAAGRDGHPVDRDRGVVVHRHGSHQRLAQFGDSLLVGVGRRGRALGSGGDVVA